MQSEKTLGIFGLTYYEEKAYLSLVRMGPSRASELAREANIARQKIYEVLESLEQKGFANMIDGKVKLYSAISPMFLEKLLIEKFETARNFLVNLNSISEKKQKDNIWIVKGKNKIDTILYQFSKTLKVEKELCVVANDLTLLSKLIKEFSKLVKKGINVKIIANNNPQTKERTKLFKKNGINVRFINHGLKVRFGICDNKMSVIFAEESMIFSDSEFLVDLVQNYFNMLWANTGR